ncbi:MAG: hypothetical protein WBA54_08420, partial [Acidaminobacteraceae bacterium]
MADNEDKREEDNEINKKPKSIEHLTEEELEKMLQNVPTEIMERAGAASLDKPIIFNRVGVKPNTNLTQDELDKMLSDLGDIEPKEVSNDSNMRPEMQVKPLNNDEMEKMLSEIISESEPEIIIDPTSAILSQPGAKELFAKSAELAKQLDITSEKSNPMSNRDIGNMISDIISKENSISSFEGNRFETPKYPKNLEESIDDKEKLSESEVISEVSPELEPIIEEAKASPEPVVEKQEETSSGGQMSQTELDALLAGIVEEEPAPVVDPEPEPVIEKPKEEKPSGGQMSQAELDAMLARMVEEDEPAPKVVSDPEPVIENPEEEASSGGQMNQAELDALLAGMVEEEPDPVITPEPEPVIEKAKEKASSGGQMSQAEL